MREKIEKFLQQIDIFDKFENTDLKITSRSSSILSIFLSTFGCIYIIIKFIRFFIPRIHRDLALNPSLTNTEDFVNISISILINLPCYFLHLDQVDSLGISQLNINSTANLRRVDKNNNFIGILNETLEHECFPCYGLLPQGSCCNSCDQLVLLSLLRGKEPKVNEWAQCNSRPQSSHASIDEKCLVKGKISVNKLSGNFHIAPGKNIIGEGGEHVHDLSFQFPSFDLSHKINLIRFGQFIPYITNPLQDHAVKQKPEEPTVYKYNLLVTPVNYVYNGKLMTKGYEYTSISLKAKSKNPQARLAPGIFFQYSFTPYTITLDVKSRSLAQFITSTAGFLSGSFAMAAMLDLFIEKRHRILSMFIKPKEEKETQ